MENLISFIGNINKENLIDILLAIAIIAFFDIFGPIISYIIIKIFNFKDSKDEIKENTFYSPLKRFFRITGIYFAVVFLRNTFHFSDQLMLAITKIYKVIVIITLANSFASSITKKSRVIKRIKEKSDKDLDDSGVKILIKVMRALIYIIAGFIVFAEIGYDLSGLVTGLGLGSVVLTLALQDTLKNIFGGIILFMDKPFKPGDFIQTSEYQGTVEDLSFRNTKIRSLDNTIVQIPNSIIAASSIENFTKIEKRRYKLDLEILLDTNINQIENLERDIYELLVKNENVLEDTINIHFNRITTNGYNIMIICYFNTFEYMKFLDIQEEINKEIIEILDKNKVKLAYDTKTIELKKQI